MKRRGIPGDVAAGLAWGFAEGSFFFLVPDILITWFALRSVRRSLHVTAAVVAGSLLAGACLFAWGARDPAGARDFVLGVPFVRAAAFETTAAYFRESGVWALCRGPASGIPYKVFAVQAHGYSALLPFLVVSIPARLERLVLSWLPFALAGVFGRGFLAKRPAAGIAAHFAFWLVTYLLYWFRPG